MQSANCLHLGHDECPRTRVRKTSGEIVVTFFPLLAQTAEIAPNHPLDAPLVRGELSYFQQLSYNLHMTGSRRCQESGSLIALLLMPVFETIMAVACPQDRVRITWFLVLRCVL